MHKKVFSIPENSGISLFDRIRQRCGRLNCYGSDADYIGMKSVPIWDEDREKSVDECRYDNMGNEQKRKASQREQTQQRMRQMQRYALLYTRFAYPPATEAQLYTTEVALGFPLPGALRALYAQVANGGFGPYNGIIGAREGHPNLGEDRGKDIVDVYHKRKRSLQFINIALYEEQLAVGERIPLPGIMFPAFFLSLCDDGGNTKIFIDAYTGRIFEQDLDGQLSFKASSLAEWLEPWLNECCEPILPKFSLQRSILS
jgi:hypothetical protein